MKPKLLAVSATDTVPAILCVAATGSDPAQGSDTSVAAAMLSSKLFFDGAGTHHLCAVRGQQRRRRRSGRDRGLS